MLNEKIQELVEKKESETIEIDCRKSILKDLQNDLKVLQTAHEKLSDLHTTKTIKGMIEAEMSELQQRIEFRKTQIVDGQTLIKDVDTKLRKLEKLQKQISEI